MKKSIITFVFITLFQIPNLFAQNSFKIVEYGKGKPILFFPGFGCTGQVWDDTVKQFSKTNKCYVFTFAGFGNVPPIETPWFETIKNDLEKFIVTNNLTKATLVGHSIGGTLNLWLASSHPSWFEQIILVDALPA